VTPSELLASREHVLLDFDGPVCAVFKNLSDQTVADRLKMLLGSELPGHITETNDPFDVLHYSATIGPDTVQAVELQLRRLEVEAVATAPITHGIAATMRVLVETGHTLTIVSNNSAAAVRAFLTLHDLRRLVRGISARTDSDPTLLKPNPFLLRSAMESLDAEPNQCLMVGDSLSDLEAARAVGMAVVVYANKSGKRGRFKYHKPDAIIDHTTELVITRI
jgi:HAD superfamily hydrolase (TIGR01662 family)